MELALAIGRHLIALSLSVASGAKYTCKGMRRRVQDTADMRLFLSQFLRGATGLGLPRHGVQLLLYIAGQSGGTISYAKAAKECGLNEGQMERSVAALVERRLIVSSVDPEGNGRQARLSITKTGERLIGHLLDPPE